jgi:vacuolar-type H+-ATPase subunit H
MSESMGAVPAANVEALRKLKEVETTWETKLAQNRSEVAARVAMARDAAEKAIQAARAEMDRLREARLTEARAAAQVEADKIIAEGRRTADAMAAAGSKGLAALQPKILAAVLGEFRDSGSDGK